MDSKLQSIRDKIMSAAANSEHSTTELLQTVDQEVQLMSEVEDIDGKGTVLDKFLGIWNNSKQKGRTGHRNKVNSWTAFALGLTSQAPVGEFLALRRCFARASYPDIDSDFQDDRRDEIIDQIKLNYGLECVGNIGTYSQMHLKSVVRSLVKALDIAGCYFKGPEAFTTGNKEKGNEIVGSLPDPMGAKLIYVDPDTGDHHEIKTVQDAFDHVPSFQVYMHKHPEIMEHAQNIEGLNSTFSVHASGIIISNHPLSELAPMRPAKKKKIWDDAKNEEVVVQSYATQFAYEDCETIGLIKFDILAIKTLTAIKQCIDMVKAKFNIVIDPENIPLDDKATFKLYQTGNCTGVFQVENFGMQRTCRDIGVDRFEDIMAAIALYRPGPMVNIPIYIARKLGHQKVDYFHPSIEPFVKPFLESTYGVCVYQEQLMQVCMAIGGLSITDGYGVIKGVGKKQFDVLAKYRGQFVSGAVKNGIPKEVAEQYWDKFVIPFANYGFNAAHSCCYGYNSYLTAYLKANYPEEYLTSCLIVESERKKWERVLVLEKDCRRNNIKIETRGPRLLNQVGLKYQIIEWYDSNRNSPAIIRPSILCKGLALSAAKELVAKAPYKNMRDLATRTSKMVDKSSIEALAEAGFLTPESDAVLFTAIREDLKKAQKKGFESTDMFE
jgi:DNA polymerase-3 subunit alpha